MTMTTTHITTTLTDYLQATFLYGNDAVTLELDTPLVEHRIVDSMGIFQLIAFLEEAFGIEIEADDVLPQRFATIEAIAAFVEQKQNGGA